VQCAKDSPSNNNSSASYPNVLAAFGSSIDLNNLVNYAGQSKPSYIVKDNTGSNGITNSKATLGRVLFYDKRLSIDSTVACASCHIQQFAFADTAIASRGVASGLTGRHSMRLVNSRFATETKFFWDERAATLEAQTTKPIQDHAEMGFSGQSGRPGLNDLLTRLSYSRVL
jgi:cytochrome c peroxidase